jgi:hypothetical protein
MVLIYSIWIIRILQMFMYSSMLCWSMVMFSLSAAPKTWRRSLSKYNADGYMLQLCSPALPSSFWPWMVTLTEHLKDNRTSFTTSLQFTASQFHLLGQSHSNYFLHSAIRLCTGRYIRFDLNWPFTLFYGKFKSNQMLLVCIHIFSRCHCECSEMLVSSCL